ncbi:MAG: C39 family peptidase [Candidatus Paceibacterota bacterium]
MKIDIPYYSQYSEKIEKDWQSKSCSITCLQMVLDFYGKKVEAMNLIEEGLKISEVLKEKGKEKDGYTREFGWGHELLVSLLKNNGVLAYRQDFKNFNFEKEYFELGLEKIKQNILDKKPVIVSVLRDIKKYGHMFIISGIEIDEENMKSFYINDPENIDNKNISIEDFKKVWRRLAIFVN